MAQPAQADRGIKLDAAATANRLQLTNDFAFYAYNCLTIRTKSKGSEQLKLNRAQKHIHAQLEGQIERSGRVRALILKGRQQGCSTYVEGRFMWKTTHNEGVRAFILTHEDDATQNLFGMARRYYDNLPVFVKPNASTANAKELVFDGIDSGYKVGTAGNKTVGRSQTNQYFHGSEVAFWSHAGEHAKGILQTVPDAPGTEVIYESTANGVNNFFHQQWKMAESGESDFIAIFVPWYWQDEYRKVLPEGHETYPEERTLANLYNLDDEQLYWMRQKIVELSVDGADGDKAFAQEYPMNAAEAFVVSGGDGLIPASIVAAARKATVKGSGPLIVGVDPSRGGDRFSTIHRQGRRAYKKRSWTGDQVDTLGKAVAKLKKILDSVCTEANRKPDMMFVDAGCGAEIVDRLHELGYRDRVKAISFAATPLDDEKYSNKRNEMWGMVLEWLADENMAVDIPDDDEIQADLCASPFNWDVHDRKCLWRKEKIKAQYGFSPDDGDALGLTFAEPVLPYGVDYYDDDDYQEREGRNAVAGY